MSELVFWVRLDPDFSVEFLNPEFSYLVLSMKSLENKNIITIVNDNCKIVSLDSEMFFIDTVKDSNGNILVFSQSL